jgi:hypothetical protein
MEVKLGVASSPHVGEDVRRHYGEVYGEMLRSSGFPSPSPQTWRSWWC